MSDQITENSSDSDAEPDLWKPGVFNRREQCKGWWG